MNLPLDRIMSFDEVEDMEYKDCPLDLDERFDDIVGISYYEDRKLEKILYAVTKATANYIRTKPMHSSQIELTSARQEELHAEYPALSEICLLHHRVHSQFRASLPSL